jgi:hypothetical protein
MSAIIRIKAQLESIEIEGAWISIAVKIDKAVKINTPKKPSIDLLLIEFLMTLPPYGRPMTSPAASPQDTARIEAMNISVCERNMKNTIVKPNNPIKAEANVFRFDSPSLLPATNNTPINSL